MNHANRGTTCKKVCDSATCRNVTDCLFSIIFGRFTTVTSGFSWSLELLLEQEAVETVTTPALHHAYFREQTRKHSHDRMY